jgi:histidine triad (HIT) family protein
LSQDELKIIERASAGLAYPSESDAPFELFQWPAQGAGSAREVVTARGGGGAGRKIEELTVDGFFAELVASDEGERYRQLRRALGSVLQELKIFRIGAGEVKVDIYLIGRTRSGDWAGLHTTSVET